jgi:hypothetical protein
LEVRGLAVIVNAEIDPEQPFSSGDQGVAARF